MPFGSQPHRPRRRRRRAAVGDKYTNPPQFELGAIDPNDLVSLVEDAIFSHIDPVAWKKEQVIEENERRLPGSSWRGLGVTSPPRPIASPARAATASSRRRVERASTS